MPGLAPPKRSSLPPVPFCSLTLVILRGSRPASSPCRSSDTRLRKYDSVLSTRWRNTAGSGRVAFSTTGDLIREGDGEGDRERDIGDAGSGTADAGGKTDGVGVADRFLNLISMPLRVTSRSDSMLEDLDDPSFDCCRVSSKTRAY
jgi:hypothetical protein